MGNRSREEKIKSKHLGAHVSTSGGVFKAPENAKSIEARAFAMFVKNQRRWDAKAYDDKLIEKWNKALIDNGYNTDYIMPHAGYLINMANPDMEKWQKSYDALIDEINRCNLLGLKYLNIHPGSHLGETDEAGAFDLIAKAINDAHKETENIIIVLENTVGKGNTLGGKFEHLAEIIKRVEDKERVGVLLDTCHTFDAGYDIKDGYDEVFEEFGRIVGFNYLKGIHLNDSMFGLACKKDRHESIGNGTLGMDFFKRFMNDPRFDNMPVTLETIDDTIWADEIKLLYSLID